MRFSDLSKAAVLGGLAVLAAVGLTGCGADEGTAKPPAAAATETSPSEAAGSGAAGDSGDDPAGNDKGSLCKPMIKYEDIFYYRAEASSQLPVGDAVGEAVDPACMYDGETKEQDSDPFPVLRITGLEPDVAVATQAENGGYWVWYVVEDGLDPKVPDAVQRVIDDAS